MAEMDKLHLKVLWIISLIIVSGCDLLPEDAVLTSSQGIVNKGIMSNAEVNAYKANTLEFVKRTYTKADGTFSFEEVEHEGALYIEVKTTSQTLSTCDSATGCGNFLGGLKLPGEFDANLDGVVNFGDIHYYNNVDFLLTAFIKPRVKAVDEDSFTTFGTFAVTPLTHLAAQKVKKIGEEQGGITEGDVDLANAQVAELFGLDGIDITRTIPPDVTNAKQMDAVSDKQKMYSALNAAVASAADSTSKTLVEVIDGLTASFVDDGGVVGNSDTSDDITLAYLLWLADDIADKVESELLVNMNTVQQKLNEEATENDALPAGELVQASEQAQIIIDTDGDDLSDEREEELGTNPQNPDTDNDKMPDGWEVVYSLDPLDPTDALSDIDNDMLKAHQEYYLSLNPTLNDTDHNQVMDAYEDPDNDGLNNHEEFDGGESEYGIYPGGTDPLNPDSDGGGRSDGMEVNYDGTDPLDSTDDSLP